jgi:hypothetical protein
MKIFFTVSVLASLTFSQVPVWKLKAVVLDPPRNIRAKYRVEYGPDSAFIKKAAYIRYRARNDGTWEIADTVFKAITVVPASETEEP